MRMTDKQDVIPMLKIRANLYTLASWYVEHDYRQACQQPRYHRRNGPTRLRVLKLSPVSAEATRYWHISQTDVWSPEEEKMLRKYYSLKRKTGDLASAIAWEKPMFQKSPGRNPWRAKLHQLKGE